MMPAMLWHALALLALCNGQLTTEEEIQVPLGHGDWIHLKTIKDLSQFRQVCNGFSWSAPKDCNTPNEISHSVSSLRLGSGLYRRSYSRFMCSTVVSVRIRLISFCIWCEATSNLYESLIIYLWISLAFLSKTLPFTSSSGSWCYLMVPVADGSWFHSWLRLSDADQQLFEKVQDEGWPWCSNPLPELLQWCTDV